MVILTTYGIYPFSNQAGSVRVLANLFGISEIQIAEWSNRSEAPTDDGASRTCKGPENGKEICPSSAQEDEEKQPTEASEWQEEQ